MPQFSLRTLIVVMTLGGPVLAMVWWASRVTGSGLFVVCAIWGTAALMRLLAPERVAQLRIITPHRRWATVTRRALAILRNGPAVPL